MFFILYDIAIGILFLSFGIYFYKSNGKAANLLSGYNMKSKEERMHFDEKQMCET